MTKFKVEQSVKIDDGLHHGIITRIDYRHEPHEYMDVVISIQEGKIIMKAGYPAKLTTDGMMGLLLQRFGILPEVGQEVEPELLIGKSCQFMTLQKPGKKDPSKIYANILPESVKPYQGNEAEGYTPDGEA